MSSGVRSVPSGAVSTVCSPAALEEVGQSERFEKASPGTGPGATPRSPNVAVRVTSGLGPKEAVLVQLVLKLPGPGAPGRVSNEACTRSRTSGQSATAAR